MSVATKTRPIKLTFRPGTPSRVLTDARRRYSRYLLERETQSVDYFQTDIAKKIEATMTPGLWLKHCREAHGWSQALLGEKLGGVKASRISDWENDQRPISKTAAKKFSTLFHLSAEHFL
ncbi:MAG TPA: helix-turn-helix transcriptional regulator [Fibrobacteria bacterium]|nr:helix-turn-helix transcriptional regulator [Fibrobacteria bacterium]